MVNQARDDEDLSAALYIEGYMDCVENLPNDLQRQLSRMLDLDANCQKYFRDFDQQQKILAKGIDSAARRLALTKVHKLLITMQDIGDEKLQIMQTIQDLIEKKARQLDIDKKNLKPRAEQENNEPLNGSITSAVCSNPKNGTNNSSNNNSNNSGNNQSERQSRRGRRTRNDTSTEPPQSTSDSNVLSENQSSNLPSTSNGVQKRSATNSSNNNTSNNNANNKKKKRKSSNYQSNQSREESPPKNDDSDLDPDEPLYCVCNQVSFGKMILCDNDSCSLEWFHFSCVSLTTKPKGKWYCPQCRGSRPNVMKSKTQFR